MNRKLMVFAMVISGVVLFTPVQAHGPGYGGSLGRVSGSVTIWSGAPYGPGYSSTINYGYAYPPVPPYAGAYYYPTCAHWHPKGYRVPKNHAYGKGYAHGYADGYHSGHQGHKKSRHQHGHGHGYDRGYRH